MTKDRRTRQQLLDELESYKQAALDARRELDTVRRDLSGMKNECDTLKERCTEHDHLRALLRQTIATAVMVRFGKTDVDSVHRQDWIDGQYVTILDPVGESEEFRTLRLLYRMCG